MTIVDVAPRDGLQSDGLVVSTEAKLALIERIVRAGITRVEATSFVNPTRVPHMSDAAALMAGLAARRAEADGGDHLAAGGNGAREEIRCGLRPSGAGGQRSACECGEIPSGQPARHVSPPQPRTGSSP